MEGGDPAAESPREYSSRIPEHAIHVPEPGNALLEIPLVDDIRRTLGDNAKSFLARAKLFLGLLALGDVRDDDKANVSFGSLNELEMRFNRVTGSILAPVEGLDNEETFLSREEWAQHGPKSFLRVFRSNIDRSQFSQFAGGVADIALGSRVREFEPQCLRLNDINFIDTPCNDVMQPCALMFG